MNRYKLTYRISKQHLISSIILIATIGIWGIFSFMQQTAVVRASSFDVNTVADATDINPGDGICEIDDVLSRGVCT
ncbi:MAG: hypothetical protein GY943_20330, partial [Chloroflexi bacterium]|nr:hypothetical protein [Chloroflexota bacterium]